MMAVGDVRGSMVGVVVEGSSGVGTVWEGV